MAVPHDTLRIAVISDPHAFSGPYEDASPSWVALGDDQANVRTNPFAGVSKLITKEALKADIIICGGDLGDKASPEGQQYVWHQIEALRLQLGATITLATAGNHDVDSRLVHTDHDARGQMQALDPLFPIADQAKWMEYWAQNYTVVIHGGVRFVLLNSSAYHGYAKDGVPAEYNQGGRVVRHSLWWCDEARSA